jgi:nucleoside diphosphate kinase
VPAGDGGFGSRLGGYLADERVAGVILRPAAAESALRGFVDHIVPELAASGAIRASWSGTLRERLSLPAPEPLAAASRAAFPTPVPQQASR